MGALKLYDPDQWSISLNGLPMHGFADGEFLTIEFDTDDFEDVVGTDGEVTRSKSNDHRVTIMVKLMQTSESNDLLSTLNNLDRNVPGGAGVGPFLVRDRQGRAVYLGAKTWIAAPPKVSLDRKPTSREWKLRCADLKRFDGGA